MQFFDRFHMKDSSWMNIYFLNEESINKNQQYHNIVFCRHCIGKDFPCCDFHEIWITWIFILITKIKWPLSTIHILNYNLWQPLEILCILLPFPSAWHHFCNFRCCFFSDYFYTLSFLRSYHFSYILVFVVVYQYYWIHIHGYMHAY